MRVFFRKPENDDSFLIQMMATRCNIYVYHQLIYELLIRLNWLFLVYSQGELLGYICFLPFKFLESVFILQIAVQPEYQSRKIGSAILWKISKLLKRRHRIKRIYLHTLKERVKNWFKSKKYKILFSVPSKLWILYRVNRDAIKARIKERRKQRNKDKLKNRIPYF